MDLKDENKVLIALVPAIHVGYLDLFKKYPNTLYILGESILKNWEHHKNLHRDLRRVDQKLIADFISKSELVKKVKILEEENLFELENQKIVMPKEDVSEWFAEKYLNNNKVDFEEFFLRWNKPISTQESEIFEDQKITTEEFHQKMIKKTSELAQKSANWWRQVGALAIKNGKILAESFNRTMPTQQNKDVYGDLRMCFDAGESHELCAEIHAEASLIAQCAKKGVSLEGAEIYITTFPCPTCAKLIAEAGFSKVYFQDGYSLSDAKDILKNIDVEVIKVGK